MLLFIDCIQAQTIETDKVVHVPIEDSASAAARASLCGTLG